MKNEQIIKVGGLWGSTKKAVALVGVLAFAGLAFGAWKYEQQRVETARFERNLAVSAKLWEATYLHSLLRQISEGKLDELKQGLSFRLTENLWDVRSLQASADEATRSFSQNVCRFIVRDEKAHPEYYLSATPGARFYEAKAWEAISDEVCSSR